MIKLKDLLSSAVKSCTQSFSFSFEKKPIKLSSKLSLMKALFKNKVIISRLLVIFRFFKSKNFQKIKNLKIINEKDQFPINFEAWYHNIIQEIKKNPLPKLRNIDVSQIFQIPQIRYQPTNFFLFESLQIFRLPLKQRNYRTKGSYIIFIVESEYSFVLKKDKNDKYRITEFSLYFPQMRTSQTQSFKKLASVLQSYCSDPSTCLEKIHSLLHSIYINGLLSDFVSSLSKIRGNIPFTLSHKGAWIKIQFPKGFGNQREFVLLRSFGYIAVMSTAPLYFPPQSETNLVFVPKPVYMTPHYFVHMKDLETNNSYPFLLFFQIENYFKEYAMVFINILETMILYTRLRTAYEPIMKSIAYNSAVLLQPEVHWRNTCPTLSSIDIKSEETFMFSFKIDPLTGFISVRILGKEITIKDFIEWNYTSILIPSLVAVFFEYAFHSTSRYTFRNKNVNSSSLKLFKMRLSYAPHFLLYFIAPSKSPSISVFDNDGNQYETAALIELKLLSDKNSMKRFGEIMDTLNGFLFILEVERIFNQNNIKTVRTSTSLTIVSSHFSYAAITIESQDTWKMKFVLSSSILPKMINRVIVTYGDINAARSAEFAYNFFLSNCYIIQTIEQLAFGSSTNQVYQLNFLGLETSFIQLQIKGFHTKPQIIIDVNLIRSLSGSSHTTNYYYTKRMEFEPKIRFLHSSPLNQSLHQYCRSKKSTIQFIAYLDHSIIPLLRIEEFIKNKKWTILFSHHAEGFQLIYNRKYTMTVELKPVSTFIICISAKFPSAALLIPLFSVRILSASSKVKIFAMKLQLQQFLDCLRRIEVFINQYEEIVDAGFENPILEPSNNPKIFFEKYDFKCCISKDKVLALCQDMQTNEAISKLHPTKANLSLMLKLTNNKPLLITVARIITAIDSISHDKSKETSETLSILENGTVSMKINNTDIIINSTTIFFNSQPFYIQSINDINQIVVQLMNM